MKDAKHKVEVDALRGEVERLTKDYDKLESDSIAEIERSRLVKDALQQRADKAEAELATLKASLSEKIIEEQRVIIVRILDDENE
jgi:hypothetical protein